MVRLIFAAVAGLGALAFCAGSATAAGFDCAKAAAPDEIAVCSNPSLSALDSQMTGLWYAYSRVPMLMGESGNRRDDAEAFLTRRRACGADVACLTSAYNARIAQLEQDITASMNAIAPAITGAD